MLNIDQDLLREQHKFLCELNAVAAQDDSYYEYLEGIINLVEELMD